MTPTDAWHNTEGKSAKLLVKSMLQYSRGYVRVLLKRIAVNKLPTTLWLSHTTDKTNSPNSKTESSVLGNGHRDPTPPMIMMPQIRSN